MVVDGADSVPPRGELDANIAQKFIIYNEFFGRLIIFNVGLLNLSEIDNKFVKIVNGRLHFRLPFPKMIATMPPNDTKNTIKLNEMQNFYYSFSNNGRYS